MLCILVGIVFFCPIKCFSFSLSLVFLVLAINVKCSSTFVRIDVHARVHAERGQTDWSGLSVFHLPFHTNWNIVQINKPDHIPVVNPLADLQLTCLKKLRVDSRLQVLENNNPTLGIHDRSYELAEFCIDLLCSIMFCLRVGFDCNRKNPACHACS